MKRISNAFLCGYERALDLSGSKKWPDITNDRTKDYEALRSDWENAGREIRKGTRKFERAH